MTSGRWTLLFSNPDAGTKALESRIWLGWGQQPGAVAAIFT